MPSSQPSKDQSLRLVLEQIHQRRQVSRTELVSATGLSKATVSGLVVELMTRGLVAAIGSQNTVLGRPRELLRLVDDARLAIGVELTDDECRVVFTNLRARLMKRMSRPVSDTALAAMLALLETCIAEAIDGINRSHIRGYQALRKQGALPILMDEGILSPMETREFIALGMLDGIAMKPARNAGLWPSDAIVRTLPQHGLMVLGSGLTAPDLSLAGAAHLFSWANIQHPCALNGPQFLAGSYATAPLHPAHDRLTLPDAPGLCLTLDEQTLRRGTRSPKRECVPRPRRRIAPGRSSHPLRRLKRTIHTGLKGIV